MRYFYSIIFVITLLGSVNAFGQDPHFTQYFSSPLSLNPANTGFIDGKYRVNSNYRQQWWNVGEAYSTTSVSVDFNFNSENTATNDKLGFGAMAIKEESMNGILKSTYVSVSAAYNKSLADKSKHMLGFGIQIAHSNKSINYSKLSYGTQFTGKGFDLSIPVDLNEESSNARYFDINTGIIYSSLRNWGNYYAGISVYHLTKPIESIFSESGIPLEMRKTVHGGATLNVNDSFGVLLSGLYMQQGNTRDRLIGSAVSFKGNSDSKVYFGLWYRLEESVIPYVGVDFNSFSIALNYGIAMPQIVTYRPRTIEFSLAFRKSPTNKLALCPRF